MGQPLTVDSDLISAAIAELRVSKGKAQMALADSLEASSSKAITDANGGLFTHYEAMSIDAALARCGINSFLSEYSTDTDVKAAVAMLCKAVQQHVAAPVTAPEVP